MAGNSEDAMDALRRAAESEMRREAPRGALGESSKRRRVGGGGDDAESDGNDDGGEGDDGGGGGPSSSQQKRPWLRFAYSGASSLESSSESPTLGFFVSSAIRKERSAAREATGVLCSLLGVPEAEEEEEEEEEGEVEVEEGKGEEEKNKGDKANGDNDGDNDDEKKNRKKPSGPCLTPTLSPVREKR